MMFKSVVVLASMAAVAFAQSIAIGAPKDLAAATIGQNIVVEVDRPDTLTGSQEVAIVISLVSCASNRCSTIPADQLLGTTLYSGPYNPQFSTGAPGLPPHQNFSVAVPATMPKGSARLAVTHLSLVGAGPFALMEVKNITLNLE